MDDKTERVEELVGQLDAMMQVPHDLVQVIAACARVCSQMIEADRTDDMPHTWLAWNWHSVMRVLPQCNTPETSEKAFRTLRCIALCMHATGFPESQSFLEASQSMFATVMKLNAIEGEITSLTAGAKQ